MAHQSHANIVDEATEGLLNRRESSLSGESDSFAQPSARVLGEPLSDRSSEMDEVKPRRLIDSQGRIVSIDQDQQKEEDSLMDFEEQERKIAQQIERDKQAETELGKATPWKMEEVNDVVDDEDEDGEQLMDEMSRIEEENEDEEEEVIKDEEEEGEGREEEEVGKERKDDEEEKAAEDDELGNGEDDDELLGFGQSLRREAPEEVISSSHSRVSESLQNRQFSGAEVLKRDEGLLQKSANSTQSSIEGFPVGYPTDPPPAYTSPRNSERPGTAKMLGPTHGKDPNGETMTTGSGFPVPSPRYASRIRHLSGGTEHAEDAEDEESEQFGRAGSSSNIRQAIGHSFAFAGGMAAAVAAGTPGSPSSSSPRATGVDASPRGGGRRLESARVVHGARTAAELRASVGSAAGRRTSAKGERSQSTAVAGQGGQQQDDQSNRYPISSELKTLFRHIEEFVADRVDIEPSLRPFQIDYIPAVGDVDPFVKIPRPDDNDELLLGLAVLDEPATQQSDSAIVDLRLHQMSGKSSTAPDAPVKKLSRADRNVHQIDRWIQNVKELRRTKAPARVTYGKPMPSIEALMQEWPQEMEQQLRGMKLMLNSSLDADLEDYADLCLGLVDIPLHKSRLESLHVLFSLYAEFRASQHFRNLALDRTETERGDTAPSTTIDQFILEEGRH